LVQGVNVELQGGAKTDPDYAKMIKNNTPKYGTVQNDGEYEDFKGKFSSLAIRKGYFDAVMEKSQLGISVDHHAAYWDFDFDSGERYRFGKLTFEGSQIREDYLENMSPFKEGEYYTSEQLAEYNQRLASTGWFNSSLVTPDIRKARAEHTDLLPMVGV
ncbi:POTRA domain-containing protein, partial [Serratia grimesii]